MGERIRQYRLKYNYSQEELAALIGVSRQSISKWENDDSYPEMKHLMKLATIFKCKLSELLNQDEDVTQKEINTFKAKRKANMQKLSSGIIRLVSIWKFITIGILIFTCIAYPIVLFSKDAIHFTNDAFIFLGDIYQYDVNNLWLGSDFGAVLGYLLLIVVLISNLFHLVFQIKITSHLKKLFINFKEKDDVFLFENINHIKNIAKYALYITFFPTIEYIIMDILTAFSFESDEFRLFGLLFALVLYAFAYIFEYAYESKFESNI